MKEKHTQWLDHQNNLVSRMFRLFIKLIKVDNLVCEADLLSVGPLLEISKGLTPTRSQGPLLLGPRGEREERG